MKTWEEFYKIYHYNSQGVSEYTSTLISFLTILLWSSRSTTKFIDLQNLTNQSRKFVINRDNVVAYIDDAIKLMENK